MALPKDFPRDPYAILDPGIRWFPADEDLREKGFDIGKTQSPVTPVFLKGGVIEATQVITDLRENFGIFCSGVIYPVVPKGVLMLRLIPTASHTLEDVSVTIDAFAEVRRKLDDGKYASGIIPAVADKF